MANEQLSNNKEEDYKVRVNELEQDEMLYQVQQNFLKKLQLETGYKELDGKKKKQIQDLFDQLKDLRFLSVDHYIIFVKQFLSNFQGFTGYVDTVLDKLKMEENKIPDKGVLVLYTGGTIGSAPKDINDPDSPQVVKSWKELKRSTPGLDRIGFRVDAISFETPLDSCNVWQDHWVTMANIIYEHYNDYEGFVILHGTDTMVYTASALSFMLQELDKPIVITGSQISGICSLRNDAHQNFITALYIANSKALNLPIIPEVCIFFGNKLIRGCRSKKIDSNGYVAFDSPNYPLLGTAGDQIEIDKSRLKPKQEQSTPTLFTTLNNTVIMIDVFPGIQNSKVIENLFKDPDLKGVILRSYGTGNIPTDKKFLELFENVTDKICIVNVTQCSKGSVEMGFYETSQLLLDRGIISGFDISPEAALVKLMMLLGEFGDDIDSVKKYMQTSISGEQQYTLQKTTFDQKGELSSENRQLNLEVKELETVEDSELINKAILRFHKAAIIPERDKDYVSIKLFVNIKGHGKQEEKLIGTFKKAKVSSEASESLAFDITTAKTMLIKKEQIKMGRSFKNEFSFTVELDDNDNCSFQWDKAVLELYITD